LEARPELHFHARAQEFHEFEKPSQVYARAQFYGQLLDKYLLAI
jgi:hypothetical protein